MIYLNYNFSTKQLTHYADNSKRYEQKSWLEVHENSDFQFKIFLSASFLTKENVVTVGTRIGDSAIDLGALQQMGYLQVLS
jgi:fumarylacetoacetase